MIIWNGFGFLVAVFVFGCSLVANLIVNNVTGSEEYWNTNKWPLVVSLIVASLLSWFVGRYLAGRKAKTLVDKETGQEIVQEQNHALFFIKMHWWGPILAVIAVVIIIVDFVK